MRIAIVLLAALASAWAQEVKMPPAFDQLAARAEEHAEVTLDSNMLQFAAKFLNDKDADEAQAKKLIAGLKSIYVRSYQFAKAGEYSPADVAAFRAQLRQPAWARVVDVKSKSEGDAEVYFRNSAPGQIGGLVVIAAEPKELTIVSITGTISPEDLAALGGNFGIPQVELPKNRGKSK